MSINGSGRMLGVRYVCEEVVGDGVGVGVVTCADQQLGLMRGQGRWGKMLKASTDGTRVTSGRRPSLVVLIKCHHAHYYDVLFSGAKAEEEKGRKRAPQKSCKEREGQRQGSNKRGGEGAQWRTHVSGG